MLHAFSFSNARPMSSSACTHQPAWRAVVFGIAGAWLLIVLLALAWASPGEAPASMASLDAVALAAPDGNLSDVPDGREAALHFPSEDEGEAEPDHDAQVARSKSLPCARISNLSMFSDSASCRRTASAYLSQAPPRA